MGKPQCSHRGLCSEALVTEGLLFCMSVLKCLKLSLNLLSSAISPSRTWHLGPAISGRERPAASGLHNLESWGEDLGMPLRVCTHPVQVPVSEGAQD